MRTARYNKFGNHKTEVDGIVFDSSHEAARYIELKLLQRGGVISCLELQPKFVLQEPFTRGTVKYRAITYVADFRYMENGAEVVEDSKGYPTPEYLLKKKMLLAKWPDMDFREV
jgi:hypothetical protein